MKARDGQRAAGFDLARDAAVIERSFGLQRDVGRLRIALVAFLDRRLHRAQSTCIHVLLLACNGGTYRLDTTKHKGGYHHMAAPAPGCSIAAFSGTLADKRAVKRIEHARLDVIERSGVAVARRRSAAISSKMRPGRDRITMMRSASAMASSTS